MMEKLKNVKFAKEKSAKKGKMVVFRRKQLAAASLVILLGIAGYLNMALMEDTGEESISVMQTAKKLGEAQMVTNNTEEESTKKNENYFAGARTEREIKRDEAIEMYNAILNASESSMEAKTAAEQEIFRLAENTQNEVSAENLIKARGFYNALVFISEDSASVAVESDGLTEADAAAISETVAEKSGLDVSCIKIVEIPLEE